MDKSSNSSFHHIESLIEEDFPSNQNAEKKEVISRNSLLNWRHVIVLSESRMNSYSVSETCDDGVGEGYQTYLFSDEKEGFILQVFIINSFHLACRKRLEGRCE